MNFAIKIFNLSIFFNPRICQHPKAIKLMCSLAHDTLQCAGLAVSHTYIAILRIAIKHSLTLYHINPLNVITLYLRYTNMNCKTFWKMFKKNILGVNGMDIKNPVECFSYHLFFNLNLMRWNCSYRNGNGSILTQAMD